jgi:hypothetical protein
MVTFAAQPNQGETKVISSDAAIKPVSSAGNADGVRITYIREPAWGGLVSHLVFADRTGKVTGVSTLSRAVAVAISDDVMKLHVEDSRSAEEAMLAEKAANSARDRSSASQVEEMLDLLRDSGKLSASRESKNLGVGARCEIECDYQRALGYNGCDLAGNTGLAACELDGAGRARSAPDALDCTRQIFSYLATCKVEEAKKWRNCKIRCAFETTPN